MRQGRDFSNPKPRYLDILVEGALFSFRHGIEVSSASLTCKISTAIPNCRDSGSSHFKTQELISLSMEIAH